MNKINEVKTLHFVAGASHNSNDDVRTESGQPASPETRPVGPARIEYRSDELLPWVVFDPAGQQAAAFVQGVDAIQFLQAAES